MKSGLFKLKSADFWKGFIMAVGTPALYMVQEMIPGWDIPAIAKLSLSAAVSYLIKNFFTDDVKQAEKTIEKAGGTVIDNNPKNQS